MGLEAITGIGPATIKKLNKAGVRTLEDMRAIDVAVVAERTGLSDQRLGEWKKEAQLVKVLDDIKGIGPAIKKKLHKAGIHTVDDLARATVHQVAVKSQLAETRVKAWQKEADVLVQKAKAEAGPRAQAAAAKGKAVAKDAAEQARRLGHDVGDRIAQHRAGGPAPSEAPASSDTAGNSGTPDHATDTSTGTPAATVDNGDGTVVEKRGGFFSSLKRLFTGKQ